MNLRPSDERVLLRDMVRRFLADHGGEAGRGPMPEEDWRALGELGVLAATLPEALGGMDGGPQDAAIIAEEFGRALAITPYAETVLGALDLLARHGTPAQTERWVGDAATGVTRIALAVPERDGACRFVRWAAGATAMLVIQDDAARLVTIDDGAHPQRLADGSNAATVRLARDAGELVPLPPGAGAAALAFAQLGYVAELVGIMELLLDQTVDYARQRQQFGAAIASFQVVQHKLARMFVRLEQARSMLTKAALLARDDPRFPPQVLAAKAYVAEAAMAVAEEAVQLHGGMGVTDELIVGRALRRVMVLARLFGRADEARQALAA